MSSDLDMYHRIVGVERYLEIIEPNPPTCRHHCRFIYQMSLVKYACFLMQSMWSKKKQKKWNTTTTATKEDKKCRFQLKSLKIFVFQIVYDEKHLNEWI